MRLDAERQRLRVAAPERHDHRHTEALAPREQALVAAREAMEKSKATLTLVDGVIAPEAPLHFQAIRLAQELVQTSRSLRSLVEMLERNPQALLLGKTPPKEQ